MKTLIITQARIGSTRLPEKVLKKIGKDSMLSLHLKRIKKSKNADKIIVATTKEDRSFEISKIAKSLGIEVYYGSTDDVLDRFYQAASTYRPKYVVRLTSDCPLIDSVLIDDIIKIAIDSDVDYCSNIITEDFPDGQDVEVFKFSALEYCWFNAKKKSDREHVTTFIRNNSDINQGNCFSAKDICSNINYNHLRMTVDQHEDLKMINWMVSKIGANCSWQKYAKFMIENKEFLINKKINRNEGYLKSLQNDN